MLKSENSGSDAFPRPSQSRPDSKQGSVPPAMSGAPSGVWKQGGPRSSVIGSQPRQSMYGARSSVYMRRKSMVAPQQDDVGVSLSTQLQNIRSSNQQTALENMLLEAALHRMTPAGESQCVVPGVLIHFLD